jgi:hypothetical protein
MPSRFTTSSWCNLTNLVWPAASFTSGSNQLKRPRINNSMAHSRPCLALRRSRHQPRVIVVAQDPREAAVFARNQLASADRLVDIAAAETRPTADSRDIVGV